MKNPTNYMVVVPENQYPEPGGTLTLLGIHPTARAATFIAEKAKKLFKLSTLPNIHPTNLPITTDSVEDFLSKTEKVDNYE